MTAIAITGASGLVGGSLARSLEADGFSVVRLGRRGADRRFALDAALDPGLLDGVDALIHAAWDVHARTAAAHRANVRGSIALFDLARVRGIRPMLFVSSMAAFPGCRSEHGRTKLEVEAAATAMGGIAIRPGTLYGGGGGGLFRVLEDLVRRARILPLVGGSVKLPLLHMCDLNDLVGRLIRGEASVPPVISAAYPELVAFAAVLRAIAGSLGRGVTLVPVPAGLAMAALKLLEACGGAPRTGSDNLISLLYPNPAPELAAEVAGVRLRPFSVATPRQ